MQQKANHRCVDKKMTNIHPFYI